MKVILMNNYEFEQAKRNQAKSKKWKSDPKYRFTASKFHLIEHRQINHETLANTLMYFKSFTSRQGWHWYIVV